MPIINNTDSVRTGNIAPHAGAAVPAGYLQCDGAAVSRTTYAQLFSVIGITYGTGDGSTTFNLPNTQGIFLSGAGSQTIGGQTHTRALGVKENDQMQGHTFGATLPNKWGDVSGGQAGWGQDNGSTGSTTYTFGSPQSDGVNGTPRYGLETRPANLPINYIIKY